MTTIYTSVSVSGYNSSPPSDDGAQNVSNKVTWSKHKTKIGDPLKTAIDSINTNLVTAFGRLFHNGTTALAVNTTLSQNDRGKLFVTTNEITITLPAASTAGSNCFFIILNSDGNEVTIDANASETINDALTQTLSVQYASAIVFCNGSEWYMSELSGSGDAIFKKKVSFPDSGELTISSGAITPTGVFHTVDTESDASTDDLATISGGTDGQILVLLQENSARDVTFTTGGNIVTASGSSYTFQNVNDAAILIYSGALTKWVLFSQSTVATEAEIFAGTEAAKFIPPSFFGDNQNLATKGHHVSPGGFCVQWGYDAATGDPRSVTFDVEFTAVYAVTGVIAENSDGNFSVQVSSVGTTGFTLRTHPGNNPVYWIAVGSKTS